MKYKPLKKVSAPTMRILVIIISIFTYIGCQDSDKKTVVLYKPDPCLNIPKEIDSIITFGSVDLNSHWKDFDSTVKFLESKGDLKQTIVKDRIKIDNWKDYYLRFPIDTCNHQLIIKNFILKNVTAHASVRGTRTEMQHKMFSLALTTCASQITQYNK